MAVEIIFYVGLAVVLHFVIEYFRRKPQIDNVSSKSVLITGCDTGFGNLLAKRLDGLGCRVFAACYTQKGADELRSCSSSRLETVLLDVTMTDSIKNAHQFVVDKLGPNEGLWGIVNNAGIAPRIHAPLEYMNKEDFQTIFDVNLFGLVDMSLHFLPLLTKSKGRIVNTSSAAGRYGSALFIEYNMSKYGVEAFSDGLRPYMKRHGVHVSIIEPSMYLTAILDEGPARDRLQRGLDRMPAEDRQVLGPDYIDKTIDVMRRYTEKAAVHSLDEVVDAYQHALFAVNPKKRYTCGWAGRLLFIPLSYMPSWIQDISAIITIKQALPSLKLSKLGS